MCRSIKTLRKRDVIATDDEIRAAARQFVRKISGVHEPTARHQVAFEAAVDDVTLASKRVLEQIRTGLGARLVRATSSLTDPLSLGPPHHR